MKQRSFAIAQIQSALPLEGHQAILADSREEAKISIREHLRRWQAQLPSAESNTVALDDLADRGEPGAILNIITRPQDGDRLSDISEEPDGDSNGIMIAADSEDQVPDVAETLPFLQQGDLVELMLGFQAFKHPRSQADCL